MTTLPGSREQRPAPSRLEFHFALAPSAEPRSVWALKPFVGKGSGVQMAAFPVMRYFFPTQGPPPIDCKLHSSNSTKTVLFCIVHTGRLFKGKGVGWGDGSVQPVKCLLRKHEALACAQLLREKQSACEASTWETELQSHPVRWPARLTY